MFILGVYIIQAKPVTSTTAKKIALSWYKHASSKVPQTLTLAYTETSPSGEAIYYAFNVNTNDGWVIVSADDAAHPIIGYATKKQFKAPEAITNIGFWMNKRKKEIMHIRAVNFKATDDITREWTGDFSKNSNNNISERTNGVNSVASTSVVVGPLVQSDWNQSPYYNAACPGGVGNGGISSSACVTGCVATTMAQIMRYWSYPATGTGSSSYNAGTYGTLSCNYGATTYSWSAMPLNDANITSTVSTYTQVAQLMYQAGVSVQMNYSPSGSGAYVLAADAGGSTNAVTSPCAQNSYVTYFGYDATTIKGYQLTNSSSGDSNYTFNQWLTLIKTDLNAGRPVQYAGQDPSQGGHTWVCDGYESNNYVHMNWGWAGSDDGYFTITNLTTTNDGFDPQDDQEILVGIQPPASVDAGISAISGISGASCASTYTPVVTITNFGVNTLTFTTINSQVDVGTVQTYTWTGSLSTGSTANVTLPAITVSAGTHTFTSSTNNPNHGTDANASNNASSFIFSANGAPTVLENTVSCGPQSYVLTASGVGSITWMDAGGTVGTGTVYTTPVLSSTTTYSATSSVLISGTATLAAAPALNTTLGGGGYLNYSHDLIFNVTSPFTLNTVDVYASSATSSQPTIELLDNTGAVVYSSNPTLSLAGKNTVSLNWHIPVGTSYSLSATGTNINLYRNNAGATYPISVGAVASITGTDVSSSDPTYYYYFYNWSYAPDVLCASPATVVTTTITSCSTTGISAVSNNSGITVYPNPAHDNLFINTDENTTSVSVTDIIGQTVIADQRVTGQQTQSIDVSNLANGVYLVKINSTDNQIKVTRFIKN